MAAVFYKDSLPDMIRESILKKQLAGNEFTTEQELCDEFKLSRTTVREALKDLESIGLIERKRRKGMSIRKPSLKEVIEIYDTREVIEGYAARGAAENATGPDIKDLRKIIKHHNSSENDVITRIQTDSAFHSRIIEMCGNSMIKKIMDNLHILDMVFRMDCNLRPNASYAPLPFTHEGIADAIEKKDADNAEFLVKSHIEAAKKVIIEEMTGVKIFREVKNGNM